MSRKAPVRSSGASIAIAGSGPVARLLACRLVQSGLPTVLLDQPAPARPSGDHRLYALSIASLELLETEGLYSALGPSRCLGFSDLEISVFREPGRVRFSASDLGCFMLGGLVYARDLDQVLAERVGALKIPTLPCDPQAIEPTGTGWQIGRGDGAKEASLLVVAEGAHSQLRERWGIPVTTLDYGEEALTFGLHASPGWGSTPRQIFTPWGPLGLLPAPDGLLQCVWSMRAARARAWIARPAPALEALVGEAMEGLGVKPALATPVWSYPLRRLHARTYARGRLVLVGDAAHVIHPFAGQGLNLGLEDVAVLVSSLQRSLQSGQEGISLALARYDRIRRFENQGFMLALEGIRSLFQVPDPLGWRALTLALLGHGGMLRKPWLRRATGLSGHGRIFR